MQCSSPRCGKLVRTSGKRQAAQPRNLWLAPRPTSPSVHHPRTALGNPDASLSLVTVVVVAVVAAVAVAAGDRPARAGHGRSAPRDCSDTAAQPRAALRGAPVRCIHCRSSAAPDRRCCISARRPGSARRQTLGHSAARCKSLQQHASARSLEPRARRLVANRQPASLDLITRRCNTLRALVADTVGRGSRNNLPVIAAAAPVLQHGPSSTASSPRRPVLRKRRASTHWPPPLLRARTHPACSWRRTQRTLPARYDSMQP